MCTVHSFPHNIDHCLTFARSEFEGHLEKAPAEANAFLLQPGSYLQVCASAVVTGLYALGIVSAVIAYAPLNCHHNFLFSVAAVSVVRHAAIDYKCWVLAGSSAILRCCCSRAAGKGV